MVQRQCLLDSNRVIAMYQAEKDSEKKVQSRFKEIVEELHASWAQETDSTEAKHIENTTSAHYKAVIDHLGEAVVLKLEFAERG